MNLKAKQMMICLMIALFFISACNRPDSPEVESGEHKALLQKGQQTLSMIDRDDTDDSEGDETFIEKSLRYLYTPHPIEADDQLLIEGLIYDLPGVTPGMVALIGEKAWVNVSFEGGELTEEQEMNEVAYILERLLEANPSYEYTVIVNHFMK